MLTLFGNTIPSSDDCLLDIIGSGYFFDFIDLRNETNAILVFHFFLVFGLVKFDLS
jgi:hypothetical protein